MQTCKTVDVTTSPACTRGLVREKLDRERLDRGRLARRLDRERLDGERKDRQRLDRERLAYSPADRCYGHSAAPKNSSRTNFKHPTKPRYGSRVGPSQASIRRPWSCPPKRLERHTKDGGALWGRVVWMWVGEGGLSWQVIERRGRHTSRSRHLLLSKFQDSSALGAQLTARLISLLFSVRFGPRGITTACHVPSHGGGTQQWWPD